MISNTPPPPETIKASSNTALIRSHEVSDDPKLRAEVKAESGTPCAGGKTHMWQMLDTILPST
eukprot:3646223-Pyramimonas_sp.AAC.1